ncbi:TolC family outer membrane protein [Halomonas eurihalina]|uniref:TolC family outer membrane protein n=1 Tax=Halomonas eurihalina TaxID=42566 RepID=A0A5D9CU25_HALER|nr:TolC family outer membrane protein [Halomonas eurihalina]MDR5860405.1 TolC family outer membrane protein [Halomonas eurihalina]TZG33921.1 TolC family outer membrane protein [Halomonas eurihalina]
MSRLSRVLSRGLLLVLCCHASLPALALDFRLAYDRALRHDPTWLAAQSESAAGRHERALGRAALLPNLNYRYSRAHNDSKVRRSTALGDSSRELDYTSYSSSFTLSQPLFDAAAYAQYREGQALAEAAGLSRERARQALAVRVLQAYTDALYAQDEVALAEAHLRALREETRRSQRFVASGEGTLTDQLEIEAQSQVIQARLIEAQDRRQVTRNELRTLVGRLPEGGELAPLRSTSPVMDEEVPELGRWREWALARNSELAAERYRLEAARRRLDQQRAGHLPTVQLFARSQISDSSTETQVGQRYDTDSVGIEIEVPLYTGGRVLAASRQAEDTLDQARHELDATTAALLNDVERQYRLLQSSQRRIRAFRDAVAAADARLKATRRSILGGERTNLDALNAEQQRFEAQRDLARARYDYLLAWLSLRWHAGVLDDGDIDRVAAGFRS